MGGKNPYSDCYEILHEGSLYDVITHANSGDDRLRGFWRGRGQKGRFPWTCFVALTTLSHYLASVWLLVIYITVDIPLLQKHRMTTNHAAGHCERPPLSTRWGPVPHIWTEPTCSACKHRHYTQCRHIEQAVSAALRALPELNWIEITDRQTCMKDMCWQSMIRLIQF